MHGGPIQSLAARIGQPSEFGEHPGGTRGKKQAGGHEEARSQEEPQRGGQAWEVNPTQTRCGQRRGESVRDKLTSEPPV